MAALAGLRHLPGDGYRCLDEVIEVLAAHAPDLRETLQHVNDNGLTHLILDGKPFLCDRSGRRPRQRQR